MIRLHSLAIVCQLLQIDRKKDLSIICDYCHKPGHKKNVCYKLVGYPPNFRFRKPQQNFIANTTVDGSPNTEKEKQVDSVKPALTEEHYKQIIDLLSKEKLAASSSGTVMNVAGIVLHTSFLQNDLWIVDTGATNHMTANLDILSDVQEAAKGNFVTLPNGHKSTVTHFGKLIFEQGIELSNVFYVPEFQYNLISVNQLIKDLQCSITFFPDFCVLQGLHNGEAKLTGRQIDGLYYVQSPRKEELSLVAGHMKQTSDFYCGIDDSGTSI